MSDKTLLKKVHSQVIEPEVEYDLKQCCVLLENLNTNDHNKSQAKLCVTPRKSDRSKNMPNKYNNFYGPFSPRKQKREQLSSDEGSDQASSTVNTTRESTSKSGTRRMLLESANNTPSATRSWKYRGQNQCHSIDITPQKLIKKKIIDSDSDHETHDYSDSGSDFIPDSSDDEVDTDDTETSSSSENKRGENSEDESPKSHEYMKINSTKIKPKSKSDYVLTPDNYFLMHSGKKNPTSIHTLEKLKEFNIKQIKHEEIHQSEEHETKIKELNKSYKRLFSWWYSSLLEEYNLIFYGHGSKRNLLNNFAQKKLSDHPCIVVNGFFPSLTMKSILEAIIVDTLECQRVPSDTAEIINTVETELNEHDVDMFLIIHNIDGPMLRYAKHQEMLSNLAQIKRLHMIVSIDHINAPLLWDHSLLSKFNFLWFETSTYLPYSVETSYETSLTRTGGNSQLSSLRSVYRSLTTNAKGIFMIIVQHQIDHQKTHYQGISFKELYSRSREQFLASSDAALRAQLTEFLDHRIMKMKRTVDGSENVVLLLDNNVLQQFMAESGP